MPAAEIFYLAYSTANNKEFISHRYDPATNTFIAVDERHVQLTAEPNLFEIKIDNILALQISDGVFRVSKFSEKGYAASPKIHFYRKKKSIPDRLATLTIAGVLAVPFIREAHRTRFRNARYYYNNQVYRGVETLTWPVNGFRFQNDGKFCAMISTNGLQAIRLKEGYDPE